MQGSSGQGNQNGQQKQGGLSWTQTPSSGSTNQNSAKPISQVQSPLMPNNNKGAANSTSNTKNTNSNNNSNLSKKAEPRQGGAGRTASIFIAGVIVGLVIGWGWFSLGGNNGKVATNTTDTTTPVTSSSSETSNNASGTATTGGTATSGSTSSGTSASTGASAGLLTVASQAAGTQVAVSSVAVSVPTWVVVFDNVNGKPGNALGAQMFFAGERSGTIDLLRATVAGKSYFVGQYIDNGDRKFSKQTDTQVNNIAGAQMLVEFTAR